MRFIETVFGCFSLQLEHLTWSPFIVSECIWPHENAVATNFEEVFEVFGSRLQLGNILQFSLNRELKTLLKNK